jgi:hypothetical protein
LRERGVAKLKRREPLRQRVDAPGLPPYPDRQGQDDDDQPFQVARPLAVLR